MIGEKASGCHHVILIPSWHIKWSFIGRGRYDENESQEAKAFKQQEEKQMANPTPRDLKNHT